MKNILSAIISVAVMATAAWTTAAVFPEGYQGERIPDGCYAIQAEVTDWLDMNPWGQVSPVGATMIGEVCVEGDIATVNLEYFASVTCEEAPWSGSEEQCEARITGRSRTPARVLPWDSSCYIAQVLSADPSGQIIARYEALVFDPEAEVATFESGAFKYFPPYFYEPSEDHTRMTWTVTEVDLASVVSPILGSARIKK